MKQYFKLNDTYLEPSSDKDRDVEFEPIIAKVIAQDLAYNRWIHVHGMFHDPYILDETHSSWEEVKTQMFFEHLDGFEIKYDDYLHSYLNNQKYNILELTSEECIERIAEKEHIRSLLKI